MMPHPSLFTPARRSTLRLFLSVLLAMIIMASPCTATERRSDADPDIAYLKGLSIEDLLQTEVTSASKKSEALFDTAAAVFVITQEDIRRTGARNIPEALRMVPGLQVAHIDANRWAITSRGFNDWFSNKLLVMIDGRSVYTPLFSGVYWDVQDTILADIDRIEIIRGPGATVWGANAVNGVINIITKKASETHGGLVNVMVGSHEQPLVEARYGGQIGASADVRVYAKGFQREPFENDAGDDAHDSWNAKRTGFRADWKADSGDDFSLDGQIYTGESDHTVYLSGYLTPPYFRTNREAEDYAGGHLLASWTRQLTAHSDFVLQAYYDRTQRDQVVVEEIRDTLDFEFKYHWDPHGPHDVVWGMGYRWTQDDIDGTWNTSFDPDHRSDDLWSTFIQDDIMLAADRLWLTIGSKFEYNDYSGFEIQPSVRLRYKPNDANILWAAVSRAVRSPSRSDHDLRVNLASMADPFGNVAVVRLLGDDDFDSEELIAYEAGYRWQPDMRFHLDLTTFYNDYDKLRRSETESPFFEFAPLPPHIVIPELITNTMKGYTCGFEGSATWRPVDFWRISISYAWIDLNLRKTGPGDNSGTPSEEGVSPKHQFQVRSYLDLPWNLHFDAEAYHVDDLASLDIDAHTRVDLRVEWTPNSTWSVSLNVENLFDDAHREFEDRGGITSTQVPRMVYGQVMLRF